MTDKLLSERLSQALALIDLAVADAASRVAVGPDNPVVRRIPCAGNVDAFRMNFSDLGKNGGSSNWDPFSHDWLAQYRCARVLIEKRKFAVLHDLVDSGRYLNPVKGFQVFAPEVIAHIKAITGDLRPVVGLSNASRTAPPATNDQESGTSDQAPTPSGSGPGRRRGGQC